MPWMLRSALLAACVIQSQAIFHQYVPNQEAYVDETTLKTTRTADFIIAHSLYAATLTPASANTNQVITSDPLTTVSESESNEDVACARVLAAYPSATLISYQRHPLSTGGFDPAYFCFRCWLRASLDAFLSDGTLCHKADDTRHLCIRNNLDDPLPFPACPEEADDSAPSIDMTIVILVVAIAVVVLCGMMMFLRNTVRVRYVDAPAPAIEAVQSEIAIAEEENRI